MCDGTESPANMIGCHFHDFFGCVMLSAALLWLTLTAGAGVEDKTDIL